MLSTFVALVLSPLVVAAEGNPEVGTQLSFRGSLERKADEAGGDPGRKAFDLTFWVASSGPEGVQLYWLLDERGRGSWPWPDRFGVLALDAQWRTSSPGPTLLYDRGEGRSVVPIAVPFLKTEAALVVDATWQEEKLQFKVDEATKRQDRDAWRISVQDGYGPKRTVWRDRSSPLVVALHERVVLGRGELYELRMELVGSEPLSPDQLRSVATAFEGLSATRGKLQHPTLSQEADWNRDQLAILAKELPTVAKAAKGTALEKLASLAQRDLDVQSGRTEAVAEQSSKLIGQPVEPFSVIGLDGETFSQKDLQGQVTVLHFWEYRDEPLKEPYGQVGYLDFMYHRRKESGLKVYGIAVDGRLGDEKTRGAAQRSAKKFKSFMNLSYPLLLDRGTLLKQFGDPRLLGANLPLFVVVGRDGKIAHYHVGHYEVRPDQGLHELDRTVTEALQQK